MATHPIHPPQQTTELYREQLRVTTEMDSLAKLYYSMALTIKS